MFYRLKRAIKFWWQRRTRGWDDSQTRNLDTHIAKFVYPRLKRFKELNNGYPCELTPEEWDERLDSMIYAMEVQSDEERCFFNNDVDWEKLKWGNIFFGGHFRSLWW